MKHFTTITLFALILCSCASMKNNNKTISGVYQVSCGMCLFDMTGDDCSLAIRIDDKNYYVEGSTIDEHGDAHARDGLCSTIRMARVQGSIKSGAFFAKSLTLIPE
ncbi:DUF6370 family protein [Crocinitomicaceae bacterium]|nr:DUF6370 family protein [Crocinitomicaceae bacterium]